MIAASVLVHIIVLAVLGLWTPKTDWSIADRSRAMAAVLMRLPAAVPAHDGDGAAAALGASGGRVSDRTAPMAPSSPEPNPPAPQADSRQVRPDEGHGTGDAPGSEPYADEGRGLRALLRGALGCNSGSSLHQTEEEKTRCNQRLAEATKGATPFSAIPPEKRAYFEAVKERYEQLRDPTPPARGGLPGALGLIKQPRFSIPGPACGMKFGGPPAKKDKRSLTDRIKDDGFASIDVGPLKCGIAIPAGSLTPEVGIPQP